ncbi:hypothetical protein BD626DRAFT_412029 [Schizophyllum amplum]|uniref:Uncharacterized protein n=1 Tax=Schizophyllum amplum TaxID=97359 RepID=A0A550BY82_9AGAR|nr:hypothetical protein BD626DRAFT_412029 [Auriculariopsis ampla]
MSNVCTLGPIDPSSVPDPDAAEKEQHAPWIMRKLVGSLLTLDLQSMTGRIVMSSYESLRAAGTSVVCLSPWGDSSPLLLPCIRFRDLAVHGVIVATGGTAAIAAPIMQGPLADAIVSSVGDSILVELSMQAGFKGATSLANDLVFDKSAKALIPLHAGVLETTGVKVLTITLKYKHTRDDAALGFFRSSVHGDPSLFASVIDYLAVEKGWFSPYLFASGRRPGIPRTMKPDVVFCHGPFLSGDYQVGQTLLAQSALEIKFCDSLEPATEEKPAEKHMSFSSLSIPKNVPSLSSVFSRSRTPSPDPALAVPAAPLPPRRLVMVVVGLKPHRSIWSSSARPDESVIKYILFNGCPAIVAPAKIGAPLLAWNTLTLEQLWKVPLPADADTESGGEERDKSRFQGVVDVLYEYMDFCVDWQRVEMAEGQEETKKEGDGDVERKKAVKDAITLLVAAAVRTGDSKEAKKEVDADRAGIAIWRIP